MNDPGQPAPARPLIWTAAACAFVWLASLVVADRRISVEVLFGLAGPLAAASATWIVAERMWRIEPARLTAVMVAAFAGKLVFFGAYVAVMLKALGLRPVPFMASFTAFFIALHAAEAASLQRLFSGDARGSR